MPNSANYTGSKTSCWLPENNKNLASHIAWITNSSIAKLLQWHWWQSTLMKISQIWHSQISSHFARITKYSIAKLPHLHWRQSILMKISKIQHWQTQHSQRQVTLLEFLNPALPNCQTYTGGKAPWWKYQNLGFTNPTYTVANHIAWITKSGNAKFWQLPWQQNILLKISKIWHWQIQHSHWQCQIPAIALAAKHIENIKNPALTNPAFTVASHFARITKSGIVKFGNYTGGNTPYWK